MSIKSPKIIPYGDSAILIDYEAPGYSDRCQVIKAYSLYLTSRIFP